MEVQVDQTVKLGSTLSGQRGPERAKHSNMALRRPVSQRIDVVPWASGLARWLVLGGGSLRIACAL